MIIIITIIIIDNNKSYKLRKYHVYGRKLIIQ